MPNQTSNQPVVLGFFAHPDDETLSAGGILAALAPRASVHVITATRGEMGEIVAPDGQRTQVDRDALPLTREAEVRAACESLGVASHEFLDGGDGRYKDSGMQWADDRRIRAIPDPNAPAEAFSRADVDEAAQTLARRIIELRPNLVITEEPAGGYGHPDHIQCNLVTMRAVEIAAPHWRVPLVTYVVQDAVRLRAANEELLAAPTVPAADAFDVPLNRPDLDAPLRTGVSTLPDAVIDTASVTGQLTRALRSHESQVHAVDTYPGTHLAGWYALTNNDLKPILTHTALNLAPGWGARTELQEFLQGLGLVVHAEEFEESRLLPIFIGGFGLIAGVAAGFAGSFAHRINPPWGLILALVAVIAGAVLTRTIGSVRTSFIYSLGAVGSVLLIGSVNRGGDIVIANDILGLGWMLGVVVLTFIGTLIGGAVVKARPRRQRTRPEVGQ